MARGDITTWIRAGAIGFAVLAMAATAVEMSREGQTPVAGALYRAARDPLAAELERCNAITPADARDATCGRAWAENRRRFLGAATHPSVAPNTGTAAPTSSAGRR